VITPKLRVLHESLLVHQLQELFLGHKIVLFAVLFAAPWPACGVRYAEAEFPGVVGEEAGEDCGFSSAAGAGDDDGLVGGERGFGGLGGSHLRGVVGECAERRVVCALEGCGGCEVW
jgi:hypothetical protein